MEFVRTPDERFAGLPGWPFAPKYAEIGGLRMHYVDEGPAGAEPVLMVHGEPSWGYLYRKMIPIITAAGLRAVVPDLFGFGRSDKPVRKEDYSYQAHVDWLTAFVEAVDLRRGTLVCQDWGGLIGLRVVAAQPERFARIVAANTFLPTGDSPPGEAFLRWQTFSQTAPELPIGNIVRGGCRTELPPQVIAAYDAPFPDDSFKAGARVFPALVPTRPDDPASEPNRQAWEVLKGWEKPFLCAFSDQDPITRGADRRFQQMVPGTKGMPHTTIEGGGHFLQEDRGEQLAQITVEFIQRTPLT
ncbi:MAG: haloalkane dehalogenase [Dehalococcoidia bacterium]